MQVTTKTLPDGAVELTILFSSVEAKSVGAPKDSTKKQIMDSDYCVTCMDGHSHTFSANGDIAAFFTALSICGTSFSLGIGACTA